MGVWKLVLRLLESTHQRYDELREQANSLVGDVCKAGEPSLTDLQTMSVEQRYQGHLQDVSLGITAYSSILTLELTRRFAGGRDSPMWSDWAQTFLTAEISFAQVAFISGMVLYSEQGGVRMRDGIRHDISDAVIDRLNYLRKYPEPDRTLHPSFWMRGSSLKEQFLRSAELFSRTIEPRNHNDQLVFLVNDTLLDAISDLCSMQLASDIQVLEGADVGASDVGVWYGMASYMKPLISAICFSAYVPAYTEKLMAVWTDDGIH